MKQKHCANVEELVRRKMSNGKLGRKERRNEGRKDAIKDLNRRKTRTKARI